MLLWSRLEIEIHSSLLSLRSSPSVTRPPRVSGPLRSQDHGLGIVHSKINLSLGQVIARHGPGKVNLASLDHLQLTDPQSDEVSIQVIARHGPGKVNLAS